MSDDVSGVRGRKRNLSESLTSGPGMNDGPYLTSEELGLVTGDDARDHRSESILNHEVVENNNGGRVHRRMEREDQDNLHHRNHGVLHGDDHVHSRQRLVDSDEIGRQHRDNNGNYNTAMQDPNEGMEGFESDSQHHSGKISMMMPAMNYEQSRRVDPDQAHLHSNHEQLERGDAQHSHLVDDGQDPHGRMDLMNDSSNDTGILDADGSLPLSTQSTELTLLSNYAANALEDLTGKPQHVLAQTLAMKTLQQEANTPEKQVLLVKIGVPRAIIQNMKKFAQCDPRVAVANELKESQQEAAKRGTHVKRRKSKSRKKVDRHLQVGETLQSAYLQCLVLLADPSDNKEKIMSHDLLNALLLLSNVYTDSEVVQQHVCALLRSLALSQNVSELLVAEGAAMLIIHGMKRFPKSLKVQAESAEALRIFAAHPENQCHFVNPEAASVLLLTVSNFPNEIPLLLSAVGAIGNFAVLAENRKALHKQGGTLAIAQVMARSEDNAHLVEKCSGAIWNLSGNRYNQRAIVNTDIPEILLQVMCKWSSDFRIQSNCFQALNNLALNPENANELVAVGVAATVTDLVAGFPNSETLHAVCVHTVSLLAQHASNGYPEKLVEDSADGFLLQTIDRFPKRDALLQECAFGLAQLAMVVSSATVGRVVGTLHRVLTTSRMSYGAQVACVEALERYSSRIASQPKLMEGVVTVDICGLLLKLLTKFLKSEELVLHICSAFEQLSHVNTGCTPRMMITEGMGKAVVRIMSRFSSAELTCMSMIRSMGESNDGVYLAFVRAGAAQAIVVAMQREPLNQPLQAAAVSTLLCLAKAQQTEVTLVRKGALVALGAALVNFPEDDELVIQCAGTLECLTVQDAHQRKLMKTEAPRCLVEAMNRFPNNFRLQRLCSGVLWNLAVCKDNRGRLAQHLDAGRVLLNAIRTFPLNPFIIETCAGAIGELASWPKNQQILNELGASEVLENTLKSLDDSVSSQKQLQVVVACALKYLD